VAFTRGVALALSATVIGLSIAIPALVGSGYLQRKVENYAVQMDSLLERINSRRANGRTPAEPATTVSR
jgi:biopolymer transport protein ExbB